MWPRRPLAQVSLNEEPLEESSTTNQLGESYVVDIQHNGKHIPFHCTDAEECKHLTYHFIECLSNKVYNTFKDLLRNRNLDSIQETYPKISIHSKIIVQFVEETNFKYGLDLKFTKLEAPEVGLLAKTFQDQQLPKQLVPPLQSEPLQQPNQHMQQQAHQMALLTDKLPLTKQQMKTDWLTSVAAQWSNHSHSTPVLLPVAQE